MNLDQSKSPVFRWFASAYGKPTPTQSEAWPLIAAGRDVLITSPTGTGKTFAAFLAILEQLAAEHAAGKLGLGIQCIYVSPLRALSYDLEKNLTEPLRGIFGEAAPIRVELRSGDTSQTERLRQATRPPHILLTTPESLCLLLSQEKWLPILARVRWAIVDEIHAIAESKRGAHLALSIERLAALAGGRLQRIGLSATVSPLGAVGRFLSGASGKCSIVDVASAKQVELSVYSPLRRDPYPAAGYTGERLVHELGKLISKHRTTLVFCNTRSGAEATTFWLKTSFPKLAEEIECHHASLERDVRRDIEDRLKRGELRAVVCSTSLEMGIDIGSIEIVVMLSTPKGVSRALQRAGRAGHDIHSVSRGVLMATNASDLVECCATVLLAQSRRLDLVRLPEAPLDILAQHLTSMACTRRWGREEALSLVRRAEPYARLTKEDFTEVLEYLAGGGASLKAQYTETFGKIRLDAEGFEIRDARVRREFLQNVGVIPSVGQVRVKLHTQNLGSVEESFIRQLGIGDIFVLSGRAVRLEKVAHMEAWVSRADGMRPTVPRWNASKMPLSNRVCEEIVAFRSELRAYMQKAESDAVEAWIAGRLSCSAVNARVIWKMHAAQSQVSEIPTADFLLVEEFLETMPQTPIGSPRETARHYFFHTLIGRAANDALARVVGLRLGRIRGGNAVATPHDYGFVLTVTAAQKLEARDLPLLLQPEGFSRALEEALAQSEMLQYHFRNAAQTGLMVYRNHFGNQKSVKKLTWSAEVIFKVLQQHEPQHVLLREARRETLAGFLDAEAAMQWLEAQQCREARLRIVEKVPPLSFAMYATKIREALLVEDPFEVQERLYHQWWSALNTP